MLRLLLAVAIVLSSPAPVAFAQMPADSGDAAAMLDAADAIIEKLQSDGLIRGSSEKAEIEVEVRKQIDRLAQGRSFASIRRNLERQIEASDDLTSEQKGEALGILQDFAGKRISQSQAQTALSQEEHPIIQTLALFILLVFIGAGAGFGYLHDGG